METMSGGYSRLAAEYNRHLRNGELGKCGKDLFLMAAALREEGRRVDELKALMLAFFFDLNGVDSGPAINRSTSKRATEAFAASGMGQHEVEELYTDTIRSDTVPKPVMSAKDSLYMFVICLRGKFEKAESLLRHFVDGSHKWQCEDCEHYEYEESWDGEDEYCFHICHEGHDEHVGWDRPPCEDFEV